MEYEKTCFMYITPRVVNKFQRAIGVFTTGLNSRWQASQHRVYIYRQGRNLNLLSQLCSLLFLDFWLYFLYFEHMRSIIQTQPI